MPPVPAPSRPPGTTGRPRKHGEVFTLADPASWSTPDQTTSTDTTHYGHAQALSWDRLHPSLTHRGPWLDHDGELPIVEGTVIRLQVDYLPDDRDPTPVWLWSSTTGATASWSICSGKRSCADSTSNTPSGCSNRPSDGPARNCGHPNQPTAGPG